MKNRTKTLFPAKVGDKVASRVVDRTGTLCGFGDGRRLALVRFDGEDRTFWVPSDLLKRTR